VTASAPIAVIRTRLAAAPASLYALALLFLVLALVVPRFATVGNLTNVARVAAILALAAFGQAVVLVTGGIDFSSGSSVALTSVVTVLLVPSLGASEALLAGCLTAVAIGAVNGSLVAWLELPPFLVTLGMLIAGHGLASLLVGGVPLEAPASLGLSRLSQGTAGGLPVPIAVAAVAFAVFLVLLRRTVLGRTWYLVGSNARAARLAGLDVRQSLLLAYVVGSLFVAAAGLILTARVSSGQPNLYPSLPFEAIAACAIGGVPLTGGAGTPAQVLAGVLIVAMIQNAVVLLNFSPSIQLMLIGGLTVGAVLVQQVAWRRPSRAWSAS